MNTDSLSGDSQRITQPNPLDNYEFRQRLGQKDHVEVWKALDLQRQQIVAIKFLRPNIQADRDFPARFLEKLKRVSLLHHPNIVHTRDFGFAHAADVSDTKGYIITDFVEGQTLADYIRKTSQQGKFPTATELVRMLIPICLAIDYAHQQGMIHGNLKPGNILLDASNTTVNMMGQPVLSDFGIAQLLRPASGPSGAPSVYTAPEQLQGDAGNEGSDLYSLGVLVYELFTGVPPFQGKDLVDPIKKRFEATGDSLLKPSMLAAVTAVMLRNLAKNPTQRFPNAIALVIALANALNIPVPDHLKQSTSTPQRSTPQDEANERTYLSPLPLSRPLGTTPSSPSWPGIASSAPLPAVGVPSVPLAGQSQGTMPQGGIQDSGSFQTFPMTASRQFPAAQAGASQPVPTVYPAASVPAQVVTQTPAVPPFYSPPTAAKRRRRGLYIALIAALIVLVVLAGSGGAYVLFFRNMGVIHHAPTQSIVGHAFFVSSGLLRLNQNSVQGITDEVQISLSNVSDPQSGNSYYAWLLSEQDNIPAILLGMLPIKHGQAIITYIDPQHTNLLANYNRFLITEESTNPAPINPSPDMSVWRYSAVFSTVPSPTDLQNHFSLYDHLRHLLAKDPKLELVNLHGGLDIWLYKNTTKVLEAAGAARDSQKRCTADPHNTDCAFVDRELVRILEYLDGVQYVRTDVPTTLQLDPVIPRVSLLEFDPVNQQPPGFLKHIGNHLRDITVSPGVTADQLALAIRITHATDNVQGWLEAVRADAVKLLQMNNAQLSQAGPILDDMFSQANYAFVGKFDPHTGNVMNGVAQIHYDIQKLATFDIQPCTITNGHNSCA